MWEVFLKERGGRCGELQSCGGGGERNDHGDRAELLEMGMMFA